MKVAEYMVGALLREGVDLLFGYPGGAILPFYDALYDAPDLRHVLVRHEQAAALAADGYARATGRVGVCVSTSGPGATNLVTGIANAFLDSVPLVAIAGQVATASLGTDAFQEVDTIGITMPVVKHSFSLRSPDDAPDVIAEAFRIARSGRPGPVLVELPKDVAGAEAPRTIVPARTVVPPPLPDARALAAAEGLLCASRRPVLYVGGGVKRADAVGPLRELVRVARIPTVATLQGLGALSGRHPLFLGMVGMHGSVAANLAVQECDLLLCAGARFDDRVTGALDGFAPLARVVHMDIDPAEIGRVRRPDVAVIGDLRESLAALAVQLSVAPWSAVCAGRKRRCEADGPGGGASPSAGRALLAALTRVAPHAVVASDVGQHQMWVAQHCLFERPENHLSSGGLGAMGYALPAAIGAQLGRPGDLVVAVSGDGSIMMNLQELATVKRYALPVKIVVMDNGVLGMVRQWQELFLRSRYSEVDLSDNPDFARVAEAFGIPGLTLGPGEDPEEAVRRLVGHRGPALLRAVIDPREGVWPIVPPGRALDEMMRGGAA